uniref:RAD51 associated protein 1 n=1 Tax=Acanthochromis polyacanthus TaxID=80966 RepID=A0A3Q1EIU7_9TELE
NVIVSFRKQWTDQQGVKTFFYYPQFTLSDDSYCPLTLIRCLLLTHRKTKVVNYSEAKDFDDDEDFACVKAPPSKKAREDAKREEKKPLSKSSSQETKSQSTQSQKNRRPLDEKLYERDLEAAITLSLLNNADGIKDQCSSKVHPGDVKVQLPVDENTDPASLHLSNCSVDGAVIGLDKITSDKGSPAPSKQRKTSSKGSEERRKNEEDEDEDYQPKLTPASTPVRSPPAAKVAPKRPASSSSVSTSKPAVSLSPAGGRIPKWNPPAQTGKHPTTSKNPAVKSPGQGLRLGLSRLVRVKPLHPSVASH